MTRRQAKAVASGSTLVTLAEATISGGPSQSINGLTSALAIPGNSTVRLTDVPNPKSTSGCHWVM